MQRYEYKVIPAPIRGEKAKGAKTPADRFAHTLTGLMNEMAARGWEYIRADTLPAEERAGFTRTATVYQNMLIFRRDLKPAAPEPAELPMVPLTAREPASPPNTAPRISVRDDSIPPAPTIKLGAAAAAPANADKAKSTDKPADEPAD